MLSIFFVSMLLGTVYCQKCRFVNRLIVHQDNYYNPGYEGSFYELNFTSGQLMDFDHSIQNIVNSSERTIFASRSFGDMFSCCHMGTGNAAWGFEDCYTFNSTEEKFVLVPEMKLQDPRMTATVVFINDRPCLIGGNPGHLIPSICLNASVQWNIDETLPQINLFLHSALVHNSVLYICGGSDSSFLFESDYFYGCSVHNLTSGDSFIRKYNFWLSPSPEIIVENNEVYLIGFIGFFNGGWKYDFIKFNLNDNSTVERIKGPFLERYQIIKSCNIEMQPNVTL